MPVRDQRQRPARYRQLRLALVPNTADSEATTDTPQTRALTTLPHLRGVTPSYVGACGETYYEKRLHTPPRPSSRWFWVKNFRAGFLSRGPEWKNLVRAVPPPYRRYTHRNGHETVAHRRCCCRMRLVSSFPGVKLVECTSLHVVAHFEPLPASPTFFCRTKRTLDAVGVPPSEENQEKKPRLNRLKPIISRLLDQYFLVGHEK